MNIFEMKSIETHNQHCENTVKFCEIIVQNCEQETVKNCEMQSLETHIQHRENTVKLL